ncbi:P1 family peptidase [Polycladidibacter hongkongensis]|uniref:P1 family peptidase n=1 Tax=Polycladidibacter hongkongensis TaxID=1647556 RepID=UPI00082C90BA|nr:P1 family peptidase [Pseudovibrio hongkongensis]
MQSTYPPGQYNLITDVPGLKLGHATDTALKSGSTVLVPDEPAVASIAIMGGAPGTRDIALLEPEQTVEKVDALVLSGGSAFGLDAAGGVQAALAEAGRGFAIGPVRVPITPTAILFDLLNGGDKNWGTFSPYRELGYRAAKAALASTDKAFSLGSVGAGTGALTADLKGGLGSASSCLPSGATLGALVAANPLGRTTIGSSNHFWAAPFEQNREYGNCGMPSPWPQDATELVTKLSLSQEPAQPLSNTTIAIIATDLALTKAQAKRIATVAHDGMARAIFPSHTPLDGDLVFVLSTGRQKLKSADSELLELGHIAALTLARAIARGIYEATPEPGDLLPCWRQRHKV